MKINSILMLLFIYPLLFSSFAFAEDDISSLAIINDISIKKTTTMQDAINLFSIVLGKEKAAPEEIIKSMQKVGVSKGLDYNLSQNLRKGTLSLLIAQYCKLYDSLLYTFFKSERYAFRTCVAHGFLDNDGSEWDPLSGEELIEIFSHVMKYTEKIKYQNFPKVTENDIHTK